MPTRVKRRLIDRANAGLSTWRHEYYQSREVKDPRPVAGRFNGQLQLATGSKSMSWSGPVQGADALSFQDRARVDMAAHDRGLRGRHQAGRSRARLRPNSSLVPQSVRSADPPCVGQERNGSNFGAIDAVGTPDAGDQSHRPTRARRRRVNLPRCCRRPRRGTRFRRSRSNKDPTTEPAGRWCQSPLRR